MGFLLLFRQSSCETSSLLGSAHHQRPSIAASATTWNRTWLAASRFTPLHSTASSSAAVQQRDNARRQDDRQRLFRSRQEHLSLKRRTGQAGRNAVGLTAIS